LVAGQPATNLLPEAPTFRALIRPLTARRVVDSGRDDSAVVMSA
jgi:hypothetical protein